MTTPLAAARALPATLRSLFPGIAVSVLVAVAAQFLSDHYGAPAMLMALLMGLALHFLAEEGTRTRDGVDYTARAVLRFGVALLGARISVDMLGALGTEMVLLVVGAVLATILFALVLGRFFGQGWQLALLTGGSVAICGASAAMAIAAILPRHAASERNLAFTILSVTVMSTAAMILYPLVSSMLGLTTLEAGVFLGGTIHDVAQVVGAGFSITPEVGETATLVKLIRVALLAPVVLIFSFAIRSRGLAAHDATGARPPILPGFVLGFLVLAVLNSAGLIPEAVSRSAGEVSRWALLIAMAAVGIKASLVRILDVGGRAIVLLMLETAFLAGIIILGLRLLS